MPGILLCGSEGEQFLYENELRLDGADDKRRGSVLLGLGQQMFRQFAAPVADFWFHIRFNVDLRPTTSAAGRDCVVISSGLTTLARLTATEVGTGAAQVLFRFDVGGVNGPTFPHAPGDYVNYDIRVQVSGNTVTASLYRDEVLRHTQTVVGSTPGQFNPADRVLVQSHFANTVGNGRIWVQDVIVTDAIPTVGMELATLVPSALGSYDDFSNDYTAIDDFGYNQSSTITSTVAGDRESWFYADPEFDLGDKVIYGLAIVTVAQTDLGGVIDDFNSFVRIAATNYDQPNIGANNIAPNAYVTVLTENPSTSQPWKQIDFVGLEAGIRSVSI